MQPPPLPDRLKEALKPEQYKKNDILFYPGHVCKRLYWIKEGLVKVSCFREDREFILRFFWENQFFTVIDSYLSGEETDCQVTALEDSTILSVSKAEVERVCSESHEFEHAYRQLVSLSSINLIRRVKVLLTEEAHTRYRLFQEHNEAILNRLSLGDTAKYIGISQASLSRLRRKP